MNYKGTKGLAVFLVTLSLLVNAMPISGANAEDIRITGWTRDINQFKKCVANYIFRGESHINLSRESFEKACSDLIPKIPKLDDNQLTYELVKVNAMLGVAHNNFKLSLDKYYPFVIVQLDGDFYIYKSIEEYKQVINKKLVSIDGQPIAQVIEKMKPYLAFENQYWLESMVIRNIINPLLLFYAGITKTADSCTLGLVDESGQIFETLIKPVDSKTKVVLIRDPDSEKILREKRPVSGLSMDNYYKAYIESSNVLYINYRSCSNMKNPFVNFVKECELVWNEKKPEKLIVDLRYNPGGNSGIVYPLIEWVKNCPSFEKPGKLFVLTGPMTMSSGVWAVCDFLENTTAIIVGEPTGGKPVSWGNVTSETLEFSKMPYQYSTGYMTRMKHVYGDTIVPDTRILWNHKDFFNAEDTVLKAVLSDNIPIPERVKQIVQERVTDVSSELDQVQVRMMFNYPGLNKIMGVSDLTAGFNSIKGKIESSTDMEVNLELCKLFAKLGNPSALAVTQYYRGWTDYRLHPTYINDGLYISMCLDNSPELLGKKLVKIGGLTIDQLIEKLKVYFCFDNGYRFICQWSEMIFQTNFLSAFGMIGDDGVMKVEYQDNDGTVKEFDYHKLSRSGGNNFATMFQGIEKPMHLKETFDAYNENIDGKLMYCRLGFMNRLSMGETDFATKVKGDMAKSGLKNILLDLRQNGSIVNGSFDLDKNVKFFHLVGAMVKANPGYSLTVAVDTLTNDDDVYIAWMLKKNYGATTIGQVPGVKPCNLWTKEPYTTSNNRFGFYLPKTRWLDNDPDENWLSVDKEIIMTANDITNQTDPVLNWMLTK